MSTLSPDEEPAIRNITFILALLTLLFPPALRAEETEEPQQFTVSLDLLADGAFAKGGPSFSPGFGAALFGDWRPLPYLSLGGGFNFALHPDEGSWQIASWDLGGRLFPLGTGRDGEWYLQGSLGLELAAHTLRNFWPGNFHGTAGPGYRFFVNPGNALDLGVQYDLFSPLHDPLQAVGVKAGWTWLFGTKPGQPQATPTATPVATPAPTPMPVPRVKKKPRKKKTVPPLSKPVLPAANAALTYTWAAGDNLSSISAAYYGSADDFPLLVDANKAVLGSPAGLKPGVGLLVPQGVSDADKGRRRPKGRVGGLRALEKSRHQILRVF